MGRIFVIEVDGRTYKCKFCKTQLATADDLVSRAFHCRRGKAYLFNNAVKEVTKYGADVHVSFIGDSEINIILGAMEERQMLSGTHTVADIFCCCCGQIVGWKYEAAHDKSQKYKEGKFVLERGRIIDGLDTEFYIDARPMSDSEDA